MTVVFFICFFFLTDSGAHSSPSSPIMHRAPATPIHRFTPPVSEKKKTRAVVGPTKPAWHTVESTCLDEDVHLPRQWVKSFGREKASVPRNRKEGPAVVHCADMSPRNASRTRSALRPFSPPADRKSDKGSPFLQKLYSSSRKNTQNCVCSRQTMSALVSAACFLPASGYTSYPQRTTHTTRNR